MPDNARYLKLLDQRLDLLGKLTEILRESRTDFVAMDLNAMERRIAQQEQLCGQIRSLDADISSLQARCAPHARPVSGRPGGDDQIRAALNRIAAAQAELKKFNDGHRSMLRRSRRTVQVLLNLVNSFAPTYSAPAAVGSTYEERA